MQNVNQKTLKGRFDSPGQGEFPGEVTFRKMAWGHLFQSRLLCRAYILRILAARVEVTARRRVSRVGNLTSEQDTFRPWAWVWAWDG